MTRERISLASAGMALRILEAKTELYTGEYSPTYTINAATFQRFCYFIEKANTVGEGIGHYIDAMEDLIEIAAERRKREL